MCLVLLFFFFSSRRRHTRSLRDWSSDVCSSDLPRPQSAAPLRLRLRGDGTVAGITEGGSGGLPAVRGGGGFSARLVGGTPNLLSDPGFEADANGDGSPDGWTISPGEGTIGSDGTVAHSGIRSVRITLG